MTESTTLVLDEFDTNLHPDLFPLLVDLFENKETNPKNAQMIFTTHNTDIDENDLTNKCKFNFGYFDIQNNVSQDFREWSQDELIKLLD